VVGGGVMMLVMFAVHWWMSASVLALAQAPAFASELPALVSFLARHAATVPGLVSSFGLTTWS
jgi:hypothetical protein